MSAAPFSATLLAVSCTAAALLPALETGRSLVLGIGGVGLSIGDSRGWKGVRLNARDAALKRMDGIHVTRLGPRGGRGGDVRGIALGVPATGGRSLRGVSVALADFGTAESLAGVGAAGLGVGAHDLLGLAVSGVLVRVVDGGRLRGAAVAPVTWVQGAQRGLSVGLVNYAWSLTGVQLGLVNIVRDNPPPRQVLPLINWRR